ncbi:MAG: hypothetical protein HY465_03865 [Deltaproteobacteria bacterium]|nr:hypothetical protein [Deltaproteobacteria bacterium]
MADSIEMINPEAIRSQTKAMGTKSPGDFNAFLDAANAMTPAFATAGQMYASPNAQAVLSSAFSGMSSTGALAQQASYPSFAGGGGGLPDYGAGFAKYGNGLGELPSPGGLPSGGEPVVPGTTGFTTADLMNSMNQNNLKLLELQAVMQSNMQAWNTKSNILSADHRARMAMIEKFTARG